VLGLQALMLLHDSRRDTRQRDGDLVLLADQDPARWDWAEIADGRAVLDRAIAAAGRGPYVLQAAIASLHAQRPCDWAQIASLYATLAEVTGSAVVELNRAVAVAELDGPLVALAIVDALELDGYRYWHATRADLLRRLGRADEAAAEYRSARALTGDGAEQRFLDRRLAELT
jgi:RNA polymerase sigma-70 factor (ECF subfamily)